MNAIKMIYEQYPYLENYELQKNYVKRDQVLYSLARFFLSPNTVDFNLRELYDYLDNEDLQLALNAIQTFFSEDTYLIKDDVEPMILQPDHNPLMNQKGFVDVLVENNMNFDRRKLNVYKSRGVLPTPVVYISGKPYWYKSQILKYVHKNKTPGTKPNEEEGYMY